jgi:hypothetical protein
MRTAMIGLVLCFSCAEYEPPRELSIDWDFSPEHRALISDAVDHWCRATPWCPRLMGEGSVGAVPIHALTSQEFARLGRNEYVAGFNDDEDAVYFNMDRIALFPDRAWHTFAHELGHFGVDHHLGGAGLLMSWSDCLDVDWTTEVPTCNEKAPPMFCIDRASAKKFCSDLGWPSSRCEETCED